ncbi:DNA primase [Luteimonas deserti]|uniref:DNA primase n=1 Tax=Luteimonas deserti TaxID=2752306 RepID=A0A7Z0QMT4_9GAMM|nr:DNA primase [Luteimonas deserti]NYZ61479.1 DNA primase [Luteimonas deserti]
MARIPDAFIDDLLARTDIVELINARVPLKRQGKEYASRCPFHDERSASFTVSPTKQFYHCFGCGAHGTAISFLMNYDRLEFLDAVDELAKRAGIEIPRETQQREARPDSAPMFEALDAAMRFFQRQLAASDKARDYLQRRGVDDAVRAQFAIGYAPDGFSSLKDALGKDDARRVAVLEKVGLLSKNDRGHSYDKFRDRVIFPIHDRRGRPIAFGGRVLDPEDSPKYLNSPETPLFHKGRELYGLWQVRQANQKIERLIVVEGYMDVVALFQFGVPQAVATLGTATTPDHAELLFRNAPDVYFCFDGDAAGRRAATRAMESVLPRMRDGRQAFFLFLPDGEDPDTIVRSEGATGLEARLAAATPLSTFFFDTLGEGISLSTLDGKARLAERAKPMLAQIPDGAFADLMRQHLAELTGLGQAAAARVQPPVRTARGGRAVPAPKRSLVRHAIALLLQKPGMAAALPPPYPFVALRQPGIELLTELIALGSVRPDISTGMLLAHFEAREEAPALQKLASQTLPGDEAIWQAELHDVITQLNRQVVQQRIDALLDLQRAGALDPAGKQELRDLLARVGGAPG